MSTTQIHYLDCPIRLSRVVRVIPSHALKYDDCELQFPNCPGDLVLRSQDPPVNILELSAVKLTLQHRTHLLQSHPVRVQLDSAKAVAYINLQEGTRSLSCRKRYKIDTLLGRNSHFSSLPSTFLAYPFSRQTDGGNQIWTACPPG